MVDSILCQIYLKKLLLQFLVMWNAGQNRLVLHISCEKNALYVYAGAFSMVSGTRSALNYAGIISCFLESFKK